jgi:glycosyltransferase involved in cell wall biosynthesis
VTGLDALLDRIASGAGVETAELLPFLCREDRRQRRQVNTRLAGAYAEIGDFGQARVFVRRAWLLSDFSEDLLPLYSRIHAALGDVAAIQAAHKRLGMKRAAANDLEAAIRSFNSSLYAYDLHQKLDRYDYDFDILEKIEQMAAPLRFRPRRPAGSPRRGRIRIAYLTHLLSNPTSVFYRINLSLARFHDKSRFSIAFFAPERLSEFRDRDVLDRIRDFDCNVLTAPEAGNRTERMLWVATRIRKYRPDLLVTNAALSDLDSYFITCLRPAPATVGLVYGPPPQFTAPSLDWCIASARHPLMDSPCGGDFVPVEVELPDPDHLAAIPRRRLGVPDDGLLLMSAARPEKFQDPGFWRAIAAILRSNPLAHYVAMGVRREEITAFAQGVPAELESRVRFIGWQEDYLGSLGAADIVIDTFPSGGGLVLMDAMALGLPVITFQNNYMRSFDQTDWSVGVEFIPIPDLVVGRGDFSRLTRLAGRLIGDEVFRHRMGRRCRETIFRTRGHPERMVMGYEAVYDRLLNGRAAGAASPRPDRSPANPKPGWFSRLRARLVPRIIKTLPSCYPFLQTGWRSWARARQRFSR